MTSGLLFRTGNVSKITKTRDILKMGPEASKMSPRVPEITQNHESDHPKLRNPIKTNQENPRKKEGTVAGYARSALDI